MVYNSNRLAVNAAETEATLTGAGLGPVTHLKNLWLQGDEGAGSGKDARRQAIAAKYCVIAMVGDQLGDFSDLFNAPGMTPKMRRAAIDGEQLRTIWGWLVHPAQPGLRHLAEGRARRRLPGRQALVRPRPDAPGRRRRDAATITPLRHPGLVP